MLLHVIRLFCGIVLFLGIKKKYLILPHSTSVTLHPSCFPCPPSLHWHCFSLQIHHVPSCHRILPQCSICWEVTSFPCSSTCLLLNLQFCSCHLHKEEIRLPLQNHSLLFSPFSILTDKDPSMGWSVWWPQHGIHSPSCLLSMLLQHPSSETRPLVKKESISTQTLCLHVLITL